MKSFALLPVLAWTLLQPAVALLATEIPSATPIPSVAVSPQTKEEWKAHIAGLKQETERLKDQEDAPNEALDDLAKLAGKDPAVVEAKSRMEQAKKEYEAARRKAIEKVPGGPEALKKVDEAKARVKESEDRRHAAEASAKESEKNRKQAEKTTKESSKK